MLGTVAANWANDPAVSCGGAGFPNRRFCAAASGGGFGLLLSWIFTHLEPQKRLDFLALCELFKDREGGRQCGSC